MINWKIRIRSKKFWLSIVPAVILLIQVVGSLLGVKINLTDVNSKIIEVINALFVVLAILGIVVDPTTKGLGDSDRALEYDELG